MAVESDPAASETTPLLDPANGNGAGNGNVGNGLAPTPRSECEEVEEREGLPDVAARMHILFPAIGIGVSVIPSSQSPSLNAAGF